MRKYKEVNGYHFEEGTPDSICEALSTIDKQTRVRIWYGNPVTGESWDEGYDTTGYIGRSCGTVKIPLIINNAKSTGGPAISAGNIIKIVNTRTRRVIYQHPTFSQPEFSALGRFVHKDGTTTFAEHENPEKAQRLADFMNGKRMNR